MKKIVFISLGLFSIFSAKAQDFKAEVLGLQSSSTDASKKVLSQEFFYKGFDCTGGNISPEITWSNAPKGTKAFAVTLFDKSAPTDSGFWHWLAFNIPESATSLKKNASAKKMLPKGTVESRTDFGKPGFGGACPPVGDAPHKYVFKVFALKDKLPLDKDASAGLVSYYLGQMKLAEVVIETEASR